MLLSYYWSYTKQVSTDLCIHLETLTSVSVSSLRTGLESAGLEDDEELRPSSCWGLEGNKEPTAGGTEPWTPTVNQQVWKNRLARLGRARE